MYQAEYKAEWLKNEFEIVWDALKAELDDWKECNWRDFVPKAPRWDDVIASGVYLIIFALAIPFVLMSPNRKW
jgi:hypothetical protein